MSPPRRPRAEARHAERQHFTPAEGIEARNSPLGGLGVFATRAFADGDVIERAPVLVVPIAQASAAPALASFAFMWDDTHVGLTLGFGSLYNHAFEPNAEYVDEPSHARPAAKRFVALAPIAAGDEITINYNGDPDDTGPVGFDVS